MRARVLATGMIGVFSLLWLCAAPALADEFGSTLSTGANSDGACFGESNCVTLHKVARPSGSVAAPFAGNLTQFTVNKGDADSEVVNVVTGHDNGNGTYSIKVGPQVTISGPVGIQTYVLPTPLAIAAGDFPGLLFPNGSSVDLYSYDAGQGGQFQKISGVTADGTYPAGFVGADYEFLIRWTVEPQGSGGGTAKTVDLEPIFNIQQNGSFRDFTDGAYTRTSGEQVRMVPADAATGLVLNAFFASAGPDSTTFTGNMTLPREIDRGFFSPSSEACAHLSDEPISMRCTGAIAPGSAFGASLAINFGNFDGKPPKFRGITGTAILEVANTDPTVTETNPTNNTKQFALAVINTPDSKFRRKHIKAALDAQDKAKLEGETKNASNVLAGRALRGTSEDEQHIDAALAVKGNEIAVARKTGRSCEWVTGNDSGSTPCDEPQWSKAKGKKEWSYTLKAGLEEGKYLAYARATTASGIVDSTFSSKDRDEIAFKVSKGKK